MQAETAVNPTLPLRSRSGSPHAGPTRRAVALVASLGIATQLMTPHRPAHAAEHRTTLPSASILSGLKRLGRVGTVLYVAAHPDDENSRLLAWLAGDRGLRAVYLSLTRGDGGQNLVGTEQDELLGLLRTHELLAARAIDGAEQRFTRARDFGYSKSTAETLTTWGKDQVLADVVHVIREVQPDAIVTRFTPQPPNHGHHMASAELAALAFKAAADPAQFAERGGPGPWQVGRLLHNVTLYNRKVEDVHTPWRVDVGGYSPLLGESWGEVAALSRSQHKSQGFGVALARGPLPEFFELLGGSTPKGSDPFADLPTRWARFPGGAAIDKLVAEAVQSFDAAAPQASLPALLRLRAAIAALPAGNPWRERKLAETDRLIVASAGLWLEARAAVPEVAPGDSLRIQVTALLGLPASARVLGVEPSGATVGQAQALDVALAEHVSQTLALELRVASDAPASTPYWLSRPADGGLYQLERRELLAQPVASPPLGVVVRLEMAGEALRVPLPVQFRWTDPVRGERVRDVEVGAPVTATPERPTQVVPAGAVAQLHWTLRRGQTGDGAPEPATLYLRAPPGWRVEPTEQRVVLSEPGAEVTVTAQVRAANAKATAGMLLAEVEVKGRRWSTQQHSIDHPHVPPLTVRSPATVRLVPVDLVLGKRRVAYLAGPGDRVAEALQSVGYAVTVLPEARLATEALDSFDVIVVGIRAFNAQPQLAAQLPRIWKWLEAGGRLVVQYQTNSRVGPLTVPVGPWPLEIGRDRVTDETAPPTWTDPASPLRITPNLLTPRDFDGWVQERGLYFAKTWDSRYRTPLQLADPGEPAQQGALVVGQVGKGSFIYTGLSFFRQLPAGVPGAWRLMANLLGP